MAVAIAFTVLLGTTFPLLAEAVRGTKLSIQAPFFNTVIAPMGYLLLMLMGVGTLIAWRRSSPEGVRRNFQWPLVLASLLTLAFFMAKWGTSASWDVYLMIWGCTFVVATILIEFGKAAHGKAKQLQRARELLDLLHREGLYLNAHSFTAIINACSQAQDLEHDLQVLRQEINPD